MIKDIKRTYYGKWSMAHSILLTAMLFMVIAESVFPQVHNISHFFFSRYVIFAVLAAYFIFRGFEDKAEVKLLFAYSIWFLITRFMNSGLNISQDEVYTFNMSLLMIMFTSIALVLTSDRREKIIAVICWGFCIFYSAAALCAIYTYITRVELFLPNSQQPFTIVDSNRVHLAGINPNIIGYWFLVCTFLSLYLFAKYKKLYARIPSALMFFINHLAITATASRSCELGFSVGIAIVLIFLILKKLKNRSSIRIALTVIMFSIILVPAVLLSFKGSSYISAFIYQNIDKSGAAEQLQTEKTQNQLGAEMMTAQPRICTLSSNSYAAVLTEESETESAEADAEEFVDKRGFKDSGRLPLFKAAFLTLAQEPERLLKGSTDDMMDIANIYIEKYYYVRGMTDSVCIYHNFHNSFLSVLVYTGLPGFAIMLAFCILLIRRMLKVYFSGDERATTAVISLAALLAAMFIYNMFEASIFFITDIRSIIFFITAGAFLAYSYEICPPRKKKI